MEVWVVVTATGDRGASGTVGPQRDQRRAAAGCVPIHQYPSPRALLNNLSLPTGWPIPLQVLLLDDCGERVNSSTVISTFSNGDPTLVLNPLGDGLYGGTWRPGKPGTTAITVFASGSGLQSGQSGPITVSIESLGLTGARTPAIFPDGVVNGASFRKFAPLAPGLIFSLFGNNLTPERISASTVPLPHTLADLSAQIGGIEIPLFYSDTGQLNAQIPFELATGSTLPLIVKSKGTASIPELVTLTRAQPGIFTVDSSGGGPGVVTHADGSLIDTDHPARQGQIVTVYATGLGVTDPPVSSGAGSPLDPLAQVKEEVSARVGGIVARVRFAGLTPGFVGLYQVSVEIPARVEPGLEVPLVLFQNGGPSNTVTVTIR